MLFGICFGVFLLEENVKFYMGKHKGWTRVNPWLGLKAQCLTSMPYLVGIDMLGGYPPHVDMGRWEMRLGLG